MFLKTQPVPSHRYIFTVKVLLPAKRISIIYKFDSPCEKLNYCQLRLSNKLRPPLWNAFLEKLKYH